MREFRGVMPNEYALLRGSYVMRSTAVLAQLLDDDKQSLHL